MYLLVLFLHQVGLAVLAAAVGIELITTERVLAAHETAAVRTAVMGGQIVSKLFPVATLLLVGSGIALVVMSGTPWLTPWLAVSMVLVLVIAVSGPLVGGRKMRAVAMAAFASQSPTVDAAVDGARRDAGLNIVSAYGTAAAIVVVFLMTIKPDLIGSLVAALVAVAAGVAIGLQRARPARADHH